MAFRTLALGDTKHANHVSGDNGTHQDSPIILPVLSSEGFFVDPQRVLKHPSFAQVEGEGIITYPFNPPETINFVLGPARRNDTTVQKTLLGSVVVLVPEFDEDVIITEQWLATDRTLSTLASFFRTIYDFWLTVPDPGEVLTWEPKDLSSESYGVHIVEVGLGGQGAITYKEVRELLDSNVNALLNETLSLRLKIASEDLAPKGVISLEGL